MKNKMKFTLLLVFLTLLTSNGSAQQKGYIGIAFGPSIPIGDFASKNFKNDQAGLARVGLHLDINFAYKLGKNLGISVLLRGQNNGFDDYTYMNEWNKQIGGSWKMNSSPWSIEGFMFGGNGSYPFAEKFSFESRVLIGFLNAKSPELNITQNGSGGASWLNQSSESTYAFSYILGAGFKFDVSKKICLLFNIDYLKSKPEFRDVEVTSNFGGAPEKNTYSQIYETINLSFGLGLRL